MSNRILTKIRLSLKNSVSFAFLGYSCVSCIEKYDFNVINQVEGLVVEASISDLSFAESLSWPSDGRYFKVKLSKTNDVDNQRDERVSQAEVKLRSKSGAEYMYTEDPLLPGEYFLRDEFFRAERDEEYQLEITLPDGQLFTSNWESLPSKSHPLGSVDYIETSPNKYVYEAGERVVKSIRGIDVRMRVTDFSDSEKRFFRWTFDPFWTYAAALVADPASPAKQCYVTSDYYLDDFVLAELKRGDYSQKLFFLETGSNWRLYKHFSTIIHQEELSESYYQFWKDLEAQKDKGGLYDQPPFGLITNFTNTNGNWTVNGYFGIVSESASRWTFDPDDLSYTIEDNLLQWCQENAVFDPRLPPDQCFDCRSHTLGVAVNTPPLWWNKN